MIENGNVYLPSAVHWKDDFLLKVMAGRSFGLRPAGE
jgi:hypothetical protein